MYLNPLKELRHCEEEEKENANASVEMCMKMKENESGVNIWDYSDSESGPASSWSTLPNRSLIFRPLPLDIGSCNCFIVKESGIFCLYTNEGQGRHNRKLAVAHHKRINGRSHFTLLSHSDDSFLGTVTANLIGSKYYIWGPDPYQGYRHNSSTQTKQPLAVVTYLPTVTTCTGSHRSMKAYIPMNRKHQQPNPMSLKNTTQLQHIKGLPFNWEAKLDRVHQLISKTPLYNKLTLEENGRQKILQLGRVGKSEFLMDYRYPLTGYQAFCISLASIDAKLCCTV